MPDFPPQQVQRRLNDERPTPQYEGLFLEPDIPPAEDEPE